MPSIEGAIQLAAKFHAGQKDKAGSPYIFHPTRAMLSMKSEEDMIAAILHDVVEDTPCTIDNLRDRGYSQKVLNAIEALTQMAFERHSCKR